MMLYPYKLVNLLIEGPIVERGGGPGAYLYNLKTGLEMLNINDIGFYSPFGHTDSIEANNKSNLSFKIKEILRNLIKRTKFCEDIYIYRWNTLLSRLAKKTVEFLAEVKNLNTVHIHSSSSFYYLHKYIQKLGYKTILTSHAPEAPFVEQIKSVLNRCNNIENESFEGLVKDKTIDFFKKITYFSFQKADYLLFPSEESLEPYFETFPEFEKIISNKKIIFVPTGVPEICSEEPDLALKRKLNIPETSVIVLFIGRHNMVKGYDILQEAAKIVWSKDKSIYFLVLGKEYPLSGLNDPRWIEVGWKSDISKYVSISDVFVLPNRRTYFDLVLLEMLSCKKVAVVSDTGGNKFVSKLAEGVVTFERNNYKDLANKLLDMAHSKKEDREKLGIKNYIAYRKYFTLEKFAENYFSQICGIM